MEYIPEIGQINFWKGIPFLVGLGRASSHNVLTAYLWNDKKYQ